MGGTFHWKKQSAHEKILVGYFYVRKVANKAKSPFNFIGLNLILSVLAPLICKWGLFCNWFLKNYKFKEILGDFSEIQSSQQVSIRGYGWMGGRMDGWTYFGYTNDNPNHHFA